MLSDKKDKYLHRLFIFSLILKAFNGLWELSVGLFILITGVLSNFAVILTKRELIEDPHDILATYIRNFLSHISVKTEYFVATYLLIHGVINIILMISLFKKKLWAYPSAITIFVIFLLYQLYRFTHTHSLILIVLCAVDVLTIYLTWREYQNHTKRIPSSENIIS